MFDTKSILASRTIWSNIVGLLCLVGATLGVKTGTIDQGATVDAILQILAGGSFLVSSFWRIVARDRLMA